MTPRRSASVADYADTDDAEVIRSLDIMLRARLRAHELAGERHVLQEAALVGRALRTLGALDASLAETLQQAITRQSRGANEDRYGERRFRARLLTCPSASRRDPGRNEPCWCGSGTKYKKCCLDEDEAERLATT